MQSDAVGLLGDNEEYLGCLQIALPGYIQRISFVVGHINIWARAGPRILGLKKFNHFNEGLKSLGILKVNDRLDINDAVMVFKCLSNLAPKYLCDQLQMRSSVCTGFNSTKLGK